MDNKKLIPKEKYKLIKSMNRKDLTDFLTRLYLNAYKDGQQSTAIDLDKLLDVKGIGPTLKARIIENAK